MQRVSFPAAVILLTSLFLTSCSGVPNAGSGGGSGSGTGTATLTLTLHSTPIPPSSGANILSFVAGITGIQLNPATGSPTVLFNGPTPITVDFVRLQSSSQYLLKNISVPAPQNFSSMTIAFSAPTVTYCTQPTSGTPGCAAGSLTTISGGLSTPQFTVSLSLASGTKSAYRINLDMSAAATITSQAVTAVNLPASAFSLTALPPTASSLTSGQADYYDNILGVVTAASSTQITVMNSQTSLITTPSSSTYYLPNCLIGGATCAPAVGQLVSIDTAVNPDGSLALLTYDPINSSSLTWLEGVVTTVPGSTTQFQIVVTDQSSSSATTLYTGSTVNVTLVAPGGAAGLPSPFLIDSKGLPISANTFAGATSATSILPGMTVGLIVEQFTAPSGTTPGTANASGVILRPTPVAGIVASVAAPNTFSIQTLPPYFGLTTNSVVQLGTGTPATLFDGAASASGISTSQKVAIDGLYLGPTVTYPFTAGKVTAY